jgi:hypothetical protein
LLRLRADSHAALAEIGAARGTSLNSLMGSLVDSWLLRQAGAGKRRRADKEGPMRTKKQGRKAKATAWLEAFQRRNQPIIRAIERECRLHDRETKRTTGAKKENHERTC